MSTSDAFLPCTAARVRADTRPLEVFVVAGAETSFQPRVGPLVVVILGIRFSLGTGSGGHPGWVHRGLLLHVAQAESPA